MDEKDIFSATRNQSRLQITIGPQFRDDLWSRYGGNVANAILEQDLRTIEIDFSRTSWADPGPLLSIICFSSKALKENTELTLRVDLGLKDSRLHFLGFIASSGFVSAFGQIGTIILDGVPEPAERVCQLLRTMDSRLAYTNSECITAFIFDTESIQENNARDKLVESLVERAHKIGIARWLTTSGPQRGILLHRIRTLMAECIDNIVEHAYNNNGFGGIFARIRPGIPENPISLERWHFFWQKEKLCCPILKRCNWKREPGWLELFVCDAGIGLPTLLTKAKKAPLRSISHQLFTDRISRFNDSERIVLNKTMMTGFQHIGQILSLNTQALGDFVRVYSNGEWIGEHLPWPKKEVNAGSDNFRRDAPPPGTLLHFSIAPPSAELEAQRKLYPSHFVGQQEDELASVSDALRGNEPNDRGPEHDFVDLHVGIRATESYRGRTADNWIDELKTKFIIIRPPRNLRKNDLLYQIMHIHDDKSPRFIAFVDVPTSLAIDIANVLNHERLHALDAGTPITIFILSNDWFCSCFNFGGVYEQRVNKKLAHDFLVGETGKRGANFVARLLRDHDSELFWLNVGDAFIDEYVKWNSRDTDGNISEFEISGYLDLTLALARPDCVDAARRAMRRVIGVFRSAIIETTDQIVRAVIDSQFGLPRPHRSALGVDSPRTILAVSVLTTGGTSTRFTARGNPNVVGIASLLRHPDGKLSAPSTGKALIALRWINPDRPLRRPTRQYERIPNTSFILRGGEREIPLPRFKASGNNGLGESLYGETPNQMYQRWQTQGLLRMGHWIYANRHDLLSISLADAIDMDLADASSIPNWFINKITTWRNEDNEKKLLVVYASHPVSDKLAEHIRRISHIELFPLKSIRPSAVSPMIISPVERENLGRLIQDAKGNVLVIILDDSVVSGATLTQTSLFLEGLWTTLKRIKAIPDHAAMEVRSLALLDRSGLPTQRDIVERDTNRHARFWRWDVPTLGHENSCPLCSALNRCRDLSHQLDRGTLTKRMKHWMHVWQATPVENIGYDRGLSPNRMNKPITTRFYIDPKNDEVYHTVYHQISTSRAAMAVEITRSTTRKDHALDKARDAYRSEFMNMDWQTAFEILASQMILYRDDFDLFERTERAAALMRLTWCTSETSPSTALAAMVLLMDFAVLQLCWDEMKILIEAKGFPNEDALIIAATYVIADNVEIGILHTSRPWSMLKLVSANNNSIKSSLSRLAQVFGWDIESVHRNAIVDLLKKSNLTANDHFHLILILELLSLSLSQIPMGMIEHIGIDPRKFADFVNDQIFGIRKVIADCLGIDIDLSDENAGVFMRDMSDKLASRNSYDQIRKKIYSKLFIGSDSIYSFFNNLFVEIKNNSTKGILLQAALKFVDDEWDAGRLPFKYSVHQERPIVLFCDEEWSEKPVKIYQDALVVRGLADLISNVRHRSASIPCPWPGHEAYELADMWIRCSPDENGSGVTIQCANGALSDPHDRGVQHTANTLHIFGVGGTIDFNYDENNAVSYATIKLPSVQKLAWGN